MKSVTLVFGLSLVILAQGQGYRDSKNAKILQEARYLQGGTHGSAYVQDDGTEFKEETDADGTRKGSYSYIDDTGKKITVQYTAGKEGFMVSGDHLPKAPQPLSPQVPPPSQPQQSRPGPSAAIQYTGNPGYNAFPRAEEAPGHFGYNFRESPQQQQPQLGNNLEYYNNGISNNQFGGFPGSSGQFQGSTSTPQPHRYFPPGKLNLNRTPDGFQYSFTSN